MSIKNHKISATLGALIFGLTMQMAPVTTLHAKEFFTIKNSELSRPTGYREWVYVGTPLTPNDMNGGKATFPEHHNVYIDPESWKYWKKNGTFRDGTILVKELVSVGSKAAASGNGYFQGEFIGLEASIKSKSNFPKEPGNWAYFSFSSANHKTLSNSTKAKPAESCSFCHVASAADDLVFTQYYPVLRYGKAKGKNAAGGFESDLNNHYMGPGEN